MADQADNSDVIQNFIHEGHVYKQTHEGHVHDQTNDQFSKRSVTSVFSTTANNVNPNNSYAISSYLHNSIPSNHAIKNNFSLPWIKGSQKTPEEKQAEEKTKSIKQLEVAKAKEEQRIKKDNEKKAKKLKTEQEKRINKLVNIFDKQIEINQNFVSRYSRSLGLANTIDDYVDMRKSSVQPIYLKPNIDHAGAMVQAQMSFTLIEFAARVKIWRRDEQCNADLYDDENPLIKAIDNLEKDIHALATIHASRALVALGHNNNDRYAIMWFLALTGMEMEGKGSEEIIEEYNEHYINRYGSNMLLLDIQKYLKRSEDEASTLSSNLEDYMKQATKTLNILDENETKIIKATIQSINDIQQIMSINGIKVNDIKPLEGDEENTKRGKIISDLNKFFTNVQKHCVQVEQVEAALLTADEAEYIDAEDRKWTATVNEFTTVEEVLKALQKYAENVDAIEQNERIYNIAERAIEGDNQTLATSENTKVEEENSIIHLRILGIGGREVSSAIARIKNSDANREIKETGMWWWRKTEIVQKFDSKVTEDEVSTAMISAGRLALQQEVSRMRTGFKKDIYGLKGEVKVLNDNIDQLNANIHNLQADNNTLRQDLANQPNIIMEKMKAEKEARKAEKEKLAQEKAAEEQKLVEQKKLAQEKLAQEKAEKKAVKLQILQDKEEQARIEKEQLAKRLEDKEEQARIEKEQLAKRLEDKKKQARIEKEQFAKRLEAKEEQARIEREQLAKELKESTAKAEEARKQAEIKKIEAKKQAEIKEAEAKKQAEIKEAESRKQLEAKEEAIQKLQEQNQQTLAQLMLMMQEQSRQAEERESKYRKEQEALIKRFSYPGVVQPLPNSQPLNMSTLTLNNDYTGKQDIEADNFEIINNSLFKDSDFVLAFSNFIICDLISDREQQQIVSEYVKNNINKSIDSGSKEDEIKNSIYSLIGDALYDIDIDRTVLEHAQNAAEHGRIVLSDSSKVDAIKSAIIKSESGKKQSESSGMMNNLYSMASSMIPPRLFSAEPIKNPQGNSK